LNELHASVRITLKQEETSNQDGMDAALCIIDNEQKTLEFAGANNSLVYIQKGELHLIKGTRRPIGGYQPEEIRRFDKHTISVKEETTVYIFSDGFQDQFGGDDGRKFRSQNLIELLQENHHRPFSEQKDILHETYLQWKGESWEQIDDILVMGFKI
jgi:serine phosphatase RsbU (regulator of sigma subunit)